MRRRLSIHARSILFASFLTLSSLALTASAVLADSGGTHFP